MVRIFVFIASIFFTVSGASANTQPHDWSSGGHIFQCKGYTAYDHLVGDSRYDMCFEKFGSEEMRAAYEEQECQNFRRLTPSKLAKVRKFDEYYYTQLIENCGLSGEAYPYNDRHGDKCERVVDGKCNGPALY